MKFRHLLFSLPLFAEIPPATAQFIPAPLPPRDPCYSQVVNIPTAGTYYPSAGDCGKTLIVSVYSANAFLLPSPGQLPINFHFAVQNEQGGVWGLNPNGLNINGSAATINLGNGNGGVVYDDSTGWHYIGSHL